MQPQSIQEPSRFRLTNKQGWVRKNVLGGPQLNTLLVGGSRSGKTALLVYAVLARAIRFPNSRHGIYRLRYNAVRQSIRLDTFPKIKRLAFPDLKVEYNDQDGFIRLPNESEIWLFGLDDPQRVDRVLGKEFITLYGNEVSQIPYASVAVANTRLAQKIPGCRPRNYYDLNPTGTGHWTYRLFFEHEDPSTRGKAIDNPQDYVYAYMNPLDNVENQADGYIETLKSLPERMRKRFLEGKYVAELPDALWTFDLIDQNRISTESLPKMKRTLVVVDPSGSKGIDDLQSDEIGIVAVAEGYDGLGYLLEDASGHYSPMGWARMSIELGNRWGADNIVAEKNFGGEMVRSTILGVDRNAPVKLITASEGKTVRAEPVASYMENGRIRHLGNFPALEDELLNFTTHGYVGDRSPNRADSYVHGFRELLGAGSAHGLLELWSKQAEETKSKTAQGATASTTVALAGAQKEAAASSASAWTRLASNSKRSAAPVKAPTAPECSCGNKNVSIFSEAWICQVCGNKGPLT